MDIDKIITDSLDVAAKDAATGKLGTICNLDDKNMQETAQQNQLLMNYSITLLRTYHEELRKELATHGIEI